MTMNELMKKVLEILPSAMFEEGVEGEVIITTGMTENSEGDLVDMEDN